MRLRSIGERRGRNGESDVCGRIWYDVASAIDFDGMDSSSGSRWKEIKLFVKYLFTEKA